MAVEHDNIDTGLLSTIGLAGAALVIAGSYYAAGIYWEYRKTDEVNRNIQPAIERMHEARAAELATLQSGAVTIDQAKAQIAERYR
ncbi:MAG: hypothetical protein O3A20_00135 [Planctomycetota bacterium]|nr:hypothetical protein [Planctomycetota bacterium]